MSYIDLFYSERWVNQVNHGSFIHSERWYQKVKEGFMTVNSLINTIIHYILGGIVKICKGSKRSDISGLLNDTMPFRVNDGFRAVKREVNHENNNSLVEGKKCVL